MLYHIFGKAEIGKFLPYGWFISSFNALYKAVYNIAMGSPGNDLYKMIIYC